MTNKERYETNRDFRYRVLLQRSAGDLLPLKAIRYVGKDWMGDRIYALRMPVTNTEDFFSVTPQHFHAECVPREALAKLDYWVQMKKAMSYARDFRPFNVDLSPINSEEMFLFDVRRNDPNPALPVPVVPKRYPEVRLRHADALAALDYAYSKGIY